MEWLAGILKYLEISKTLVIAVFITAAIMYFGPICVPGTVPGLPAEYSPFVFATIVLTGCVLAIWVTAAAWNASKIWGRVACSTLRGLNLSDDESAILVILVNEPFRDFNLEEIEDTEIPFEKPEFLELAKGLDRKGYVKVRDWNHARIGLTEKGISRGIELRRQWRQGRRT